MRILDMGTMNTSIAQPQQAALDGILVVRVYQHDAIDAPLMDGVLDYSRAFIKFRTDLVCGGNMGSVLGRSEQGAFPALRLSGRPHIYMAFVPIMHNRPFLCRIWVWPT